MQQLMSRREALKILVFGAGLLAGGSELAAAEDTPPAAGELPHLNSADPLAVALAYQEDANTVDAAKFRNFKPDQKCATCVRLMGKEGDAWRPCSVFPGQLVNAEGWCKVYVKKT